MAIHPEGWTQRLPNDKIPSRVMSSGEIALTVKGERWARSGHPWVYQDDLKEPDKSLSGGIVRMKAPNGSFMGQAFYNARSKIDREFRTGFYEGPDLYCCGS